MTHSHPPIISGSLNSTAQDMQRGARSAVPVLLGFIPFALVLGAQASQKHLSPIEVALMTALNFGGGSEFAAIELWSSPPQVWLIVAMTLLVNSRHLLMGATLAPYLAHLPMKRVLPSLFFMCDESWAMSLTDAGRRRTGTDFSLAYFLGLSLCLWLTWVAFTSLGSTIGPQLGDLRVYGFDMAFAAVFLVLLRGMWKGFRAAQPWLVSLSCAALTYLTIPGGWYVLTGTIAGLAWAYWRAR